MAEVRELEGKAVVVTGAGRGLGRAYAGAIANAGARVVGNDIDRASAESVCGEILHDGGVAKPHVGSAADWETANELIDACSDWFGAADGLVNNAAVFSAARPWDETEA